MVLLFFLLKWCYCFFSHNGVTVLSLIMVLLFRTHCLKKLNLKSTLIYHKFNRVVEDLLDMLKTVNLLDMFNRIECIFIITKYDVHVYRPTC